MKYHEAQQAYAALSNATGGGSWESTNPAAGAGQTAHGNNSTGFSNAKKDAANSDGFNDVVRDHPEFKNFYRNYAEEKFRRESKGKFRNESIETEPAEFLDFPLGDYFSRWERIFLTVIGSIVVLFIAVNFTWLSFTFESSVRLFWHTAVFVLISWLIFWCIRFIFPSRSLSSVVNFFLSATYAVWICFFEFHPEFIQFSRAYGRGSTVAPVFYCFYSFSILKITTNSLEGEGLSAAFIGFFRDFFSSVFSRD